MNRLFLLRHAKAVPPQAEGEDRDRPLTGRGEADARAIGGLMAEQGLRPDLVLCSSARRTRRTLAAILPLLRPKPQLYYEDGLYLAAPAALLARLRKVPAARESVLLVGHNPGLHELAVMLAADAPGALARRLRDCLPTAGLAGFEIAGAWDGVEPEQARLQWFVTPKELGGA